MEKRYQVFVSSTCEDLKQERQEVIQALLELDCIPSGMELFPAADDDQWTLIKQVIDDCDYYVVIIGGRYGSVGPDGISFTQKEYEYALSKKKPIIAFLHKEPGKIPAEKTESTQAGKKKLEELRKFTEQKMVKYWSNPDDLGSVVSRSIIMLIKNNPAIGWVRADLVPDESASKEILKLNKEIGKLTSQLAQVKTEGPEGIEDLSQGDDEVDLKVEFQYRKNSFTYLNFLPRQSFLVSKSSFQGKILTSLFMKKALCTQKPEFCQETIFSR
jgi:hypothetical protein